MGKYEVETPEEGSSLGVVGELIAAAATGGLYLLLPDRDEVVVRDTETGREVRASSVEEGIQKLERDP